MSTVKAKKVFEVIRPLKAPSGTIRANFIRLFDNIEHGSKRIGVSHTHVFQMINAGEVSAYVVGKLYKLGIDPSELIKKEAKR